MASRTGGILAAVAIVAASVALAALLVSLAPEPERRELQPQVPFVLTGPVSVAADPIPVSGAGEVRPVREVAVAPQVGGKIRWIAPEFQSGGRAQAGQTLVEIEDEDYRHRVEIAMADVAARQVALLEAEEWAAIASSEYEMFARRQDDTDSEPNPLALRQPQLRAARAALARDEARLAEARLALSRATITAPFAGYVREESVAVGQIVAPGQMLGRLFAADMVEIVVSLADGDAALIPGLWELRAGDDSRRVPARVISEYGERSFFWNGYVDRAEAAMDTRTRTLEVIVRVLAPFAAGAPVDGSAAGGGPPLLVGEFVDVEIEGATLPDIFRVPRAALQPGNEVWIAQEDGTVAIIPVEALRRTDNEAWVGGALRAGQRAITGGLAFAVDGMRVLTEAGPP